jgi:Fic family protein
MIEEFKQFFKRKKDQKHEEIAEKTVEEWKKQVEELRKHPLTQVKILSDSLLNELNQKLGDISSKLDQVLNYIRERQAPEISQYPKSLTVKDRELIKLLEDRGPLNTRELAKALGVNRTTASIRLNKLASVGVLDKKSRGKEIEYSKRRAKK